MVQLVRHLVPTHLGACHMTSRDLTIDNVTCRIHVTARERTSHVTTFRLSLFLPGEDKGEETSSLVPRPESRLGATPRSAGCIPAPRWAVSDSLLYTALYYSVYQ